MDQITEHAMPNDPSHVRLGRPYFRGENCEYPYSTHFMATQLRTPGILRILGLEYVDRYEEYKFHIAFAYRQKPNWSESIIQDKTTFYGSIANIAMDELALLQLEFMGKAFGYAAVNYWLDGGTPTVNNP